jgi:hypothetical protein
MAMGSKIDRPPGFGVPELPRDLTRNPGEGGLEPSWACSNTLKYALVVVVGWNGTELANGSRPPGSGCRQYGHEAVFSSCSG